MPPSNEGSKRRRLPGWVVVVMMAAVVAAFGLAIFLATRHGVG